MNILIADDHQFIIEDLIFELGEIMPEAKWARKIIGRLKNYENDHERRD